MAKEGFAAQLAVKAADTQLRLLVDLRKTVRFVGPAFDRFALIGLEQNTRLQNDLCLYSSRSTHSTDCALRR